MNKRIKIIVITLLAIPVLYFVGREMSNIYMLQNSTFKSRDFDQQLWLKGNIRFRGEMVKNLQESKKLDNLTKNEVIKLLGQPDSIIQDGNTFIYRIDVFHLSPDPRISRLCIYFTKDGNVSAYTIEN